MTLGELIRELEKHDPSKVVREGFDHPHSYRGSYHCVAFEPAYCVSVYSMLRAARSALGATYEGYKGGSYTMSDYTDVYLSTYGDCGEELGARLLRYMLADVL